MRPKPEPEGPPTVNEAELDRHSASLVQCWCEVCELEMTLSPVIAEQEGWQFAPITRDWGVVAPSLCPDCPDIATAWWATTVDNLRFEELTPAQRMAVVRIYKELPADYEKPWWS